jgi:hypothetical protein
VHGPPSDLTPIYSYDDLVEFFSEIWLGAEDIVDVVAEYRATHTTKVVTTATLTQPPQPPQPPIRHRLV